MNKFIPFFFDGNQWFNTVDSPDMWKNLLKTYELEKVAESMDLGMSDVKELLDRADKVWEEAKTAVAGPEVV